MKVLFISSGNNKEGISPIVFNQGKSIIDEGCDVVFYTIDGKGIFGYLKHIFKLRKYIKQNKFSLFHAHYSLCGFVATLSGAKPLIVSLMGSDVLEQMFLNPISKFCIKHFWKGTIVKSEEMKQKLGFKKITVISNGVNFEDFKPIEKGIALEKLNWDRTKKHILFAANTNRKEKNYKLTLAAFQKLNNKNLCLHSLTSVKHAQMPYYYNAADVVVLSSIHEGSPNVIKEAMACNRPIVSTNVGDVKEIIGSTEGCYITDFTVSDFSSKLNDALSFERSTEGRNNISTLNSKIVAQKIISIYNKHLK